MATVKQTALIEELLSKCNEKERLLCEPVIRYLLELGYLPAKAQKQIFGVSFEKKGRKIMTFEYGKRYKAEPSPYLSLCIRYSASRDYSTKFQQPIIELMEKHVKKHGSRMGEWNTEYCCGNCKGNPRLYSHTWSDGTKDSWCGGFSLVFTDLSFEDVPELLRHIKNQDEYFEGLFGA